MPPEWSDRMSRPDLITCSVGAERVAWVRQNGFELSAAVKRLIDSERGADRVALQTADTLASLDPTAKDPSDRLPNPPPAGPHGWRRQGLRWIARAGSLDDAARLASVAVGAKLAAPHVLLTAEEVPNV